MTILFRINVSRLELGRFSAVDSANRLSISDSWLCKMLFVADICRNGVVEFFFYFYLVDLHFMCVYICALLLLSHALYCITGDCFKSSHRGLHVLFADCLLRDFMLHFL